MLADHDWFVVERFAKGDRPKNTPGTTAQQRINLPILGTEEEAISRCSCNASTDNSVRFQSEHDRRIALHFHHVNKGAVGSPGDASTFGGFGRKCECLTHNNFFERHPIRCVERIASDPTADNWHHGIPSRVDRSQTGCTNQVDVLDDLSGRRFNRVEIATVDHGDIFFAGTEGPVRQPSIADTDHPNWLTRFRIATIESAVG